MKTQLQAAAGRVRRPAGDGGGWAAPGGPAGAALAEQSGISSQEEWTARLQGDPAFRQHVEDVMALAAATEAA